MKQLNKQKAINLQIFIFSFKTSGEITESVMFHNSDAPMAYHHHQVPVIIKTTGVHQPTSSNQTTHLFAEGRLVS